MSIQMPPLCPGYSVVPGSVVDAESNVIFGGRLAEYKYYDMAPVIEQAIIAVEKGISSDESSVFIGEIS